MTHKLKYDGHRWVAPGTDLPQYLRQQRARERSEGDHFISGLLVGIAGGGFLTTIVLSLALLVH